MIPSLRMLGWIVLLTGVIYPLLITAIGYLVFHKNAEGSLLYVNGKVVGSALIGQKFDSAKYFWPRPSAHDYDALSSGGSNFGPTSKELKKAIGERQQYLAKAHQTSDYDKIPPELLFASGSGLDPHISPIAAEFQIQRILKARNWTEEDHEKLVHLIRSYTKKRFLGFIGEKAVNVLQLNIALDEMDKEMQNH